MRYDWGAVAYVTALFIVDIAIWAGVLALLGVI